MASRARKFQPLRRTGHRPVEPLSAQVEYLRTLKGVLQYARALVNARLMPRVERWVGERTDANTPQNKQVSNVVGQIRSALESKFTDAKLERVAESTADRISDHQRAQLTAQVGVELPARSERGLGQVTDAFTFENVALIKSVPSQYLDGVQSAVLAGLSAGQRHEDLAKVLEAKFQIGEKRAALIARDQVNKFNGRLAQVRQENLGIVSYVWHAQPDQRTRDTHADRDGQTYDWSDPPGDLSDPADGGHPGQAINCRCWAEGIIPGLEDDDTEAEPADDEGEDDAPEPVKRELDFEMTGGTRPPPWDSRSSMHGEWLKQRLPGGSSNGEDDE